MSGNLAYHGDNVSSAYIEEKSSYVIEELVEILSILECAEMPDKDTAEQIHNCAKSALYDALKIIATTIDAQWEVADNRIIADCGDAKSGWEAIQYKYTGQMKKIWGNYKLNNSKEFLDILLQEKSAVKAELACRKSFCKQAKELLQQPRALSRTALNELVDSFAFPDSCFKRLNYLLNAVNMNTIDWNEFVKRSTANLKYLENQLNEQGEEYIKGIQNTEKHKVIAIRNGEYFDTYTGEEQPHWEAIDS